MPLHDAELGTLLCRTEVLTGRACAAGDALPASHADHPLGTRAARSHLVPPQLLLRLAHAPPQRRPRHGPGSPRHEVHPAPFCCAIITECHRTAVNVTQHSCLLAELSAQSWRMASCLS